MNLHELFIGCLLLHNCLHLYIMWFTPNELTTHRVYVHVAKLLSSSDGVFFILEIDPTCVVFSFTRCICKVFIIDYGGPKTFLAMLDTCLNLHYVCAAHTFLLGANTFVAVTIHVCNLMTHVCKSWFQQWFIRH